MDNTATSTSVPQNKAISNIAPTIPPVQLDNIPAHMRQYDHFVLWHFEHDGEAKDGSTEWRKVPLQPNGQNASTKTLRPGAAMAPLRGHTRNATSKSQDCTVWVSLSPNFTRCA